LSLRKIANRKSQIDNGVTMRAAAIDVGTNTVRLLVGEPDGAGGYRSIFAAQEITRLGPSIAGTDRDDWQWRPRGATQT
jgi:hypothetical protein